MHLRAAASLLPSLVKAQTSSFDLSLRQLDSAPRLGDVFFSTSENQASIKFLLGAFLWLDILASASTRANPTSALKHEILLQEGDIKLDALFGCENWALILILRIAKLDQWKRECSEIGKLSVAELAKEAAEIEESIRHELTVRQVVERNQTNPVGSTGHTASLKVAKITKVFALSGLTYLHVVLSGAHPNLTEITDSVSRTIEAFEAFDDMDLLQNVIWPFCITGCLVPEERQSAFKDLIPPKFLEGGLAGNVTQAWRIVERCWQDRKGGLSSPDWISAMDSIGQRILLV